MRALVVDDEPVVLELMERILEDAGWTVMTARTFHDGRALLAADVDVLIADVRLADYNGLQLALLIHEANARARVIIVSGIDDPVIRRDADEFGATFLLKPFRAADFLAAVAAAPTGLKSEG